MLVGSLCALAHGTGNDTRRLSIDAQIGGNISQPSSASQTAVPRYRTASSPNSGMISKLHVEYYLPKSKFSLKAGYEHEELNFLKGDRSRDLDQLMLGGRWYPAPATWKVAPYAGVDILYAPCADRGSFTMTSHMSWRENNLTETTYSYTAEGVAKAPRFSIGPMIGADIYLFSSIALQLEYGYRFGLDAPYYATYTEEGSGNTSYWHGQLHRHVLSVGLKFTFPFRWTHSDGRGLLEGILNSL